MLNSLIQAPNITNFNAEETLDLINNSSENTTVVTFDDSYFQNSNVYAITNFDHWKDKKKQINSSQDSQLSSTSLLDSKFKIFIPDGVEGLPKKTTPVAIFPSDAKSTQFNEALEDRKTLPIKKITISKKKCSVFELQIPKKDPRFLGFQTTSITAINILAKKFQLNDAEQKKLENDIIALTSTKLPTDCIAYVFLDICSKHEDIAKMSLIKDVDYQNLIKNSQKKEKSK